MHPLLKELERDNDPHDVIEIAPGVVLAGRAEPEFATLAPGGQNRPAELQIHPRPSESAAAQAPSLDTTFRAEDVHHGRGDRSSAGAWARRVFIGVLLSVCGAVAAAPWQHYGDAAKAMIATWVPQLVATSSPPPANPAPRATRHADAEALRQRGTKRNRQIRLRLRPSRRKPSHRPRPRRNRRSRWRRWGNRSSSSRPASSNSRPARNRCRATLPGHPK